MKITLLLLLVLQICFTPIQAQDLKPVAYKNLAAFVAGESIEVPDLLIEKSTVKELRNGMNDFKISSPSKAVKKSAINREFLFVVQDDMILVNCMRTGLNTKGYSKATVDGGFIYFVGTTQDQGAIAAGMLFGLAGALIAAAASDGPPRVLMAIDMENKEVINVHKELNKRLKNRPELADSYKKEPEKNEKTLIKYFKASLKNP